MTPTTLLRTTGERFAKARRAVGLDQDQLAAALASCAACTRGLTGSANEPRPSPLGAVRKSRQHPIDILGRQAHTDGMENTTNTPTDAEIAAILAQLNDYTAENIWEDVIYTVTGFNADETDRIDRGRSDRFIADGVEYVWDESTDRWSAWS